MKPKYNIFQLLHDASLRLGKDLDKLMHRSLDTEAILEKGSSSSVMSDSTLMLTVRSLDALTEAILEKGSSSSVMSDSTLMLMLHSLDTLTEAILEKGSSSNVMSDSTLPPAQGRHQWNR